MAVSVYGHAGKWTEMLSAAEQWRQRSLDHPKDADLAMYAKAALAAELGLEVSLCGAKADGKPF